MGDEGIGGQRGGGAGGTGECEGSAEGGAGGRGEYERGGEGGDGGQTSKAVEGGQEAGSRSHNKRAAGTHEFCIGSRDDLVASRARDA